MSPSLFVAVGLGLAVLGSGACSGTTAARSTLVYDHPVTYVESVPPETVYQPRVYYRGRYAYLVRDRWYYPTDGGWVVFREEPRELARYRVNYRDPARHEYQYRNAPEYRFKKDAPEFRYRAPAPL